MVESLNKMSRRQRERERERICVYKKHRNMIKKKCGTENKQTSNRFMFYF